MTDYCADCELEMTNDCPRYGGKADCEHAPEAVRGLGYDIHTDSCYTIPECPKCGGPLFIDEDDIGKVVECGCGRMIRIPDTDWTRKYVEDFTGEKVEEMPCLTDGCDGVMKVKKVKRSGEWQTAGGQCEKCGAWFIV